MQANQLSTYLSGRILLTIVFCLLILFAISYLAIYQPQKTQNQLEQKISEIRSKIVEQKKYQSLHKDLQVRLKQFEINERLYQMPELREISLTKKNLQEISDIIHEIAHRAGLQTVSVDPDAQTLTQYESKLKINATFKGDISNFRNLVLNLGSLGYVDPPSRRVRPDGKGWIPVRARVVRDRGHRGAGDWGPPPAGPGVGGVAVFRP